MGKLDDLERLYKLKESGVLTEDEFNSEKRKILNSDNIEKKEELKETKANNISNSNTVLDENDYTIATKEGIASSSIKIIGIALLWCGIGFISFSIPIMTTSLGLGLAALICSWFIRPFVGDCPYCKSKVKSYNKAGFICPRCRKNVAVKDNKFFKIKN